MSASDNSSSGDSVMLQLLELKYVVVMLVILYATKTLVFTLVVVIAAMMLTAVTGLEVLLKCKCCWISWILLQKFESHGTVTLLKLPTEGSKLWRSWWNASPEVRMPNIYGAEFVSLLFQKLNHSTQSGSLNFRLEDFLWCLRVCSSSRDVSNPKGICFHR